MILKNTPITAQVPTKRCRRAFQPTVADWLDLINVNISIGREEFSIFAEVRQEKLFVIKQQDFRKRKVSSRLGTGQSEGEASVDYGLIGRGLLGIEITQYWVKLNY